MFSPNKGEKKGEGGGGSEGGKVMAVIKNNELLLLDCSLKKGAETVLQLKLGHAKT